LKRERLRSSPRKWGGRAANGRKKTKKKGVTLSHPKGLRRPKKTSTGDLRGVKDAQEQAREVGPNKEQDMEGKMVVNRTGDPGKNWTASLLLT